MSTDASPSAPSKTSAAPGRLEGVSHAVIRELVRTLVERRAADAPADAAAPSTAPTPHDEDHAHRLAALFEAAFLMAAADGDLASIEIEELGRIMVAVTEGRLSEETAYLMLNEYLVAYRREGFRPRLARVAEVLADDAWRRAAVQLAARVAYADGTIESTEESAFRAFARAFGLGPEEIGGIVESMLRPRAG